MGTTSQAQRRAVSNWQKKNKEKSNRYKFKGSAKSFIKNEIKLEEIQEFIEILEARRSELEEEVKERG